VRDFNRDRRGNGFARAGCGGYLIGIGTVQNQKSIGRLALENLFVAGAIFLAAIFGKSLLPSAATSTIPVLWPGAGVALAAALLLGWRGFPGMVFPFIASGVASDFPWSYGVLSPLGVCGLVLLSAWILGKAGFDPRLPRLKDIFLLALGAVFPMSLAGFWTANCLMISGKLPASGIGEVAVFFGAAYTGGALVVTPALLLVASGRLYPKKIGWGKLGLGAIQLAMVFASTWAVFSASGKSSSGLSIAAYLPFPFVIWAALSGGMGMASLAVLVSSMTAAFFTGSGLGPFVSESAMGAILQLQAFIGILAASGLLIGSGTEARWREKALQAEAATRKAELERLKAQVNPHFLFNCLTAIHSLIRTDSGAAEEGLTSLSSLLRKSLDVAKHPLIPLAEELEIIRDALRLQKMRYEDKAAEEFRVPPMLLQPLVENAVKHGVSDGFGRVDLSAVVHDGDLIVKVRNTAPEDSDPAKWQDSVGLASVRARIEEACPPGSGVEFTKTPDRWIQALVRIKRVG
jgi:integral membrane sensor domain MASE1